MGTGMGTGLFFPGWGEGRDGVFLWGRRYSSKDGEKDKDGDEGRNAAAFSSAPPPPQRRKNTNKTSRYCEEAIRSYSTCKLQPFIFEKGKERKEGIFIKCLHCN